MGFTFVKVYLFILLVNSAFFLLQGVMDDGQAAGLPNTNATFITTDEHFDATLSPGTQFINTTDITGDNSTLVGSLHNPTNATGFEADIAFEQDQIIPLGIDDFAKFISGGFVIDVVTDAFGVNFGAGNGLPDEFFIVWGVIVGFLIATWLLYLFLKTPTI